MYRIVLAILIVLAAIVVGLTVIYRAVHTVHTSSADVQIIKQARRSRTGFPRGSAGNALHQLRSYVHPHVKHAIVQMQEEEVLKESSLDTREPVAHLHRQAVRIQKG
jgi:hypothetical protein